LSQKGTVTQADSSCTRNELPDGNRPNTKDEKGIWLPYTIPAHCDIPGKGSTLGVKNTMKLFLSIACMLISTILCAQKLDTLKCRATFSDPESAATNKRVSVTNFYVVLKDSKPVKFLMMDKRRETTMEIWDYRLVGEPRIPKQ
jgi:hypothetical protein